MKSTPPFASRRLKYLARINPDVMSEETDPDFEMEYVDIGNVDASSGIQKTESFRFSKAPSRARRLVKDGDTIVATVRTYLRAIASIENPPDNLVVSTGFAVLRAKPEINSRFLSYALRSEYFVFKVIANSYGVSYPAINPSALGCLSIHLPTNPKHQQDIVTYLDRETRRIDTIIEKNRRLLELIEEKRTAFIWHAVTRGIALGAKKSTPSHWELWKIGHLARIGNGSTPSRTTPDYWAEDGMPWLNSAVANNDTVAAPDQFVTERALKECHLPLVSPGSILVALTGEGKTRGMAALLEYPATISQHLAYIVPNARIVNPRFLQRQLQGFYYSLRAVSEGCGGTKGALTCEALRRFRLPLPPLTEQEAIATYLEKHLGTFSILRGKIESAIDLLRERRLALISAAVTGQMEIPSS